MVSPPHVNPWNVSRLTKELDLWAWGSFIVVVWDDFVFSGSKKLWIQLTTKKLSGRASIKTVPTGDKVSGDKNPDCRHHGHKQINNHRVLTHNQSRGDILGLREIEKLIICTNKWRVDRYSSVEESKISSTHVMPPPGTKPPAQFSQNYPDCRH